MKRGLFDRLSASKWGRSKVGNFVSRRGHAGFSIVEILIVITVTGVLFASAILLINGKQRVTSFNQSIRNVQTEMEQIANDVRTGYYPNDGSISCAEGGSGPLLSSGGSNSQGTNKDCIFLGKVMQFAVGTTDPETYNVYTMVGLTGNVLTPSIDLASAKARLIAKGSSESASSIPDAFETKQLLYGLKVSKMYYNGSTLNAIGAVGLTSSLKTLSASDTSQQLNVVAIRNTPLHDSKANGVTAINGNLATGVVNPNGGIQICFDGSDAKQSGLITIGGGSRQGTVSLRIFSTAGCV